MHRTCRQMLCVEVLEARLALSAVAADVTRPDLPVAAEVGPEPVAVGTDATGETIYAVSVPPRQCMCASCLGTWDGPVSAVRLVDPPAPAVEPAGDTTQADRTGSPDVIAQAATAPTGYSVALPPAPTTQTGPTPEVLPSDPTADVSREVGADQIVTPAAVVESEPTVDLVAPAGEREADDLALALTV